MQIIAHRGSSYTASENTIAAVELAWKEQADAVEVDIHLTRDGHVVVMHDANTLRTAGKSLEIRDSTLTELRELDVGSWKGEEWAGEKVPLLEEVLATVPDGGQLVVEIKCGPEIIPALTKIVRDSEKSHRQIVVVGFGLETLRAVKHNLPELDVFLIASVKKDESGRITPPVDRLIADALNAGLGGLDLSYVDAIDAALIGKIHKAGLNMVVWTVDDPEVARRMASIGVDALTTNRPGWMREQLLSGEA